MLQFIPVHEENTFAIRASGKLTHADYQAFLPELEQLISRYEKVSLFIELDNFSGWELEAAKDDFQFGLKHGADFEKIAIVGEKAWHQWMTMMAKPFMDGEVRYFSRDELQQGWDWVRSKESAEQIGMTETTDKLPQPYQRIAVAVDFSPHSERAAQRAVLMSKYFDAKLTILHVANDIDQGYLFADTFDSEIVPAFYDPGLIASLDQSLRELAQQRMQQLVNIMGDNNIETQILVGSPAETIISYVEAQKVNLLIMGTHGRRGIAKLLGSTAHSVQNKVRNDVLLVPLG